MTWHLLGTLFLNNLSKHIYALIYHLLNIIKQSFPPVHVDIVVVVLKVVKNQYLFKENSEYETHIIVVVVVIIVVVAEIN